MSREIRSLIDLGTASVKVLVVELRERKTHIWGHGYAPLAGGYGPGGEIVDREAVAAACDAALTAAEDMTLESFGHKIVPDQSLWSVPGWLCRGQTLSLRQRRPRPEKSISKREQRDFEARLERAVEHLADRPLDIISTIQVEGQAVTEAIGLRGESLSLQAFIVSANSQTLDTLQKIAAALKLEPPAFVSQARAAMAALSRGGVILDIGRWGTGIVAATNSEQLTVAGWASLGGQSLYRALLNGFGLTPAQLPDFCRAYSQGHLPPEIVRAADAALVDPVNRWLDLVVEQLPARTVEASLPHQIYLAGEAARLPAVLLGARRYPWMQNLQWSRHPEISLWQPSGVSDLKNHSTRVWNASDLVRLGLARLILDIR